MSQLIFITQVEVLVYGKSTPLFSRHYHFWNFFPADRWSMRVSRDERLVSPRGQFLYFICIFMCTKIWHLSRLQESNQQRLVVYLAEEENQGIKIWKNLQATPWNNALCYTLGEKRIEASKFGRICKLPLDTDTSTTVMNMIYTTNIFCRIMEYGKKKWRAGASSS